MAHAVLSPGRSYANLARLELDNLARFGTYSRLHYEDRTYTNLEEFRYAGQLAYLLREFGVNPGDRVLVMMPNTPDLTAAFPAVWMIGASIVPVIPQWTPTEAAAVIQSAEPLVVLTVPPLAARLHEAAAATGLLKHLLVFGETDVPGAENIAPLFAGIPALESPVDRGPEDLALLLYTSGTTATPKGVMLTHGNLFSAIEGVYQQNAELPRGPTLHSLPLTHVYGVLMQILANGWALPTVLLRQFEPARVLEAIQRHRVMYLPVVPTMLVYLLNHPARQRYDLSSLFRITSGGAPLPERLRQDAERVFACRVQQGYGLSESAAVATGYRLEQAYRTGSCGQATPGVQIRIADDHGRSLPPGRSGEICLAGPNIAIGYWRDAAGSSEALRGGWLHTGDIGYLDEDGYLFITDRKKDLIIKGGENISPREIEEALYTHPAVAECAVLGIPDAVFGEEICALIQLKPGAEASAGEIRQYLAGHVTKFKIPSRVAFLPALPKNTSGKISKRDLRAQL